MRFSTTNMANHHPTTPSMATIKKVLSNLVSKLPHHHSNNNNNNNGQPTFVKIDSRTNIKLVKKTSMTALKKEKDMNQDIRNYYRQQNSSKKRQLEEADGNKKMESERERRHKTVKQYQQTQESHHHHWIEHSNPTVHNNKSAQQPKWVNTHGYIRDTRTNSNYLRVMALTNHSNNKLVLNKEKSSTKKRTDEFIWGKQSPLRNVTTLS